MRMHFMPDGSELAVAHGSQGEFLLRLRTRADHAKHLRTLRHQFHGTLYLLCRQCRKHGWSPRLSFATEASTHEQSNHADIFFRDAEHFCHVAAPIGYSLRGVMQRELIAIPLRDGGVSLHGIVMVDWRGVGLFYFYFGLCEPGIHITPACIARFAVVLSGIGLGKTGFKVELGRLGVIAR